MVQKLPLRESVEGAEVFFREGVMIPLTSAVNVPMLVSLLPFMFVSFVTSGSDLTLLFC